MTKPREHDLVWLTMHSGAKLYGEVRKLDDDGLDLRHPGGKADARYGWNEIADVQVVSHVHRRERV